MARGSDVNRTITAAALLFGSGFAALTYETVWLRQFRLVFGSSTSATAAVLAIYLGGLGIGSIILGRRVDRASSPLRLYATLEAIVCATAAISPLLIRGARGVYAATGGVSTLGSFGAAIVRLLLAAIVLLPPTIAMGGTLPALIRAVGDDSRKAVAALYGANTIGGCAGVVVATFVAIERLGHRNTILMACVINALVALIAWLMSWPQREGDATDESSAVNWRSFLPVLSAVNGFAFLLMEIVWYRELIPLVGGTTYSFGTILTLALLGVGAGGAISSVVWHSRRPSMTLLASVVALEAFWLLVPFALGDRIATLALLVHPATSVGFGARLTYMACCTAVVVLMPAILSGIQMPLIIAMAGDGNERAGSDAGTIIGVNTLASIAGSLAGGFGFLPLLGANGCWRLAAFLLIVMAFAAAFRANTTERRMASTGIIFAVASVVMLFANGPTEFWRQTPIGAARIDQAGFTANSLRNFERFRRRTIVWSRDGVESAVGLADSDGLAFLINGQNDGHARFDAGTQVMIGLLGALVHPHAQSAFVVGLGTGSTAGWLAAMPEMQRVDVVELEPIVRDVATACAPVNANAMQNPKIHLSIGDAREALLTTRDRYDVIASEPSNPSRSGVASFFTSDFYKACAGRLNESGLFLQWLQGYEIDARTVRIVYATLLSVFPHVETWETKHGDLLLVASFQPVSIARPLLESRLRQEPFRTALFDVWRATTVEAMAARFVAGERTAQRLAVDVPLNTDDKPAFEFALARTVGTSSFDTLELRRIANAMQDDAPQGLGAINRAALEDARVASFIAEGQDPTNVPLTGGQARVRATAGSSYLHFDYNSVLSLWNAQGPPPTEPMEIVTIAEAVADAGNEQAMQFIQQIAARQPIEAQVMLARLRFRQSRFSEAAAAMAAAFNGYQTDPWPSPVVMNRALSLCVEIARTSADRNVATTLYDAAQKPFAVMMFNDARLAVLLQLATMAEGSTCGPRMRTAVEQLGPHFPWVVDALRARITCARSTVEERDATNDYRAFIANEPPALLPQN
jgi:spermidine synthase